MPALLRVANPGVVADAVREMQACCAIVPARRSCDGSRILGPGQGDHRS
jgi:hypothetical protein